MSERYLYVNPLGETQDISYNNVSKLKNSMKIINARLEDSKLQNKSHHLHLSIWSVTAGLSIIALLLLLRGINN